jgi:hypothetical protein
MKIQVVKVNLFAVAIAIQIVFTGCSSVRDQVPATQISGYLNGRPFTFSGPKDLSMTNFVAEVETNGTCRVSIGAMSAAVDPNVITMTGQAYATMRAADSALLDSAISTVAGAAGTVAGAAVKTP